LTVGFTPRLEAPTEDDRFLWDLWLARFHLPAVAAADKLEVFSCLERSPAAAAELAAELSLREDGCVALLGTLAGLGLLRRISGRYHLARVGQEYLLPSRPFYWGGVFARFRAEPSGDLTERLVTALRARGAAEDERRITLDWASGRLDAETARFITAYMHSHSFGVATGFARHTDWRGVRRLLDVGAGSGCFSVAAAMRQPELICTMLDLPAVCVHADALAHQYGLEARVTSHAANFFTDDWPRGHDAVLLSNILHDWDLATCRSLLTKAFDALPSGGRVFVHEIILGDEAEDNLATHAFSLAMLIGTQGRQLHAAELEGLLRNAGFTGLTFSPSSGHFWTAAAERP
jgi:predicted nicotinamide N-methyase